MAYDGGKRLLLYALVKGLGDAVRLNDQSAAERYRRRLRLASEQFAADDPVQGILERLLSISGLWVEAAATICRKRVRERAGSVAVRSAILDTGPLVVKFPFFCETNPMCAGRPARSRGRSLSPSRSSGAPGKAGAVPAKRT